MLDRPLGAVPSAPASVLHDSRGLGLHCVLARLALCKRDSIPETLRPCYGVQVFLMEESSHIPDSMHGSPRKNITYVTISVEPLELSRSVSSGIYDLLAVKENQVNCRHLDHWQVAPLWECTHIAPELEARKLVPFLNSVPRSLDE